MAKNGREFENNNHFTIIKQTIFWTKMYDTGGAPEKGSC